MNIQTQYERAICETDADWELYCKHPTQTTWDLYVESKLLEKRLEAELDQTTKQVAEDRCKKKS